MNIGTAVLVFIAALDLHLPILYMIGISGLILAFKLASRWRPAIAGLLSAGLVFFGPEMMKQAFRPLASSPGFAQIGRFFAHWPYAAFFLGTLLCTSIHSSSAVAAIAITINKGGELGEFPAMMVIAGLGLGTALATFALSSNLRGVPRQIATYQAVTNMMAGFVLTGLLGLERLTGAPLLIAAMHRLSPSISGRILIGGSAIGSTCKTAWRANRSKVTGVRTITGTRAAVNAEITHSTHTITTLAIGGDSSVEQCGLREPVATAPCGRTRCPSRFTD